MKGKILDFSISENKGYISGEDNKRYVFSGAEWKEQSLPRKGSTVDFETTTDGKHAKEIFVISTVHPSALTHHEQVGEKNRIIAMVLAFCLGGIGAHKFYLGQIGLGVLYLLFFWTLIPAIVSLVEFIIYLTTSDEDFAKKYG